jgi:hypothetical protein
MLPAAGILLTERLYIGIKINSLTDESPSEYATLDDGQIDIDIIDGRDKGFTVRCNGVTVNSTNGKNIVIGGFTGGTDGDRDAEVEVQGIDYTLSVFDKATKVIDYCTVRIGYNGSGSSIIYNGTAYTSGSFNFDNHWW